MNPQTANQNDPQTNIEARVTTMRVIWFALILSVGIYYMITLFVGRSPDLAPNQTLSLALAVAAVSTTAVSFLIKGKLIGKAVEQRNIAMVQQAYVTTWAITEVAALLGVLDFFSTSDRYYHLFFVLAALGLVFHTPRREHVETASFKSGLTT
jgi:magnesium-transporting ATPase (P-type)